MKRNRSVLLDTLKKSRAGIAVGMLFFLGSQTVFFLYRLPLEPFLYAYLLLFFLGTVLFAVTYAKERSKAKRRERMIGAALTEVSLPPADTLAEEDLQEVISRLRQELVRLQNAYETKRQEETDYYTAWVHQIKTPISVMRMELGGEETQQARLLRTELFRIEQYVDMVLQYIRLGSDSHDLVIKEYPLDSLIRESIRKFAPQFVAKRLRLCYDGTDCFVITDRKWFSCILEQLLSNAIKYTPSGSISIALEDDVLSLSDTGIGIAPEDLPRIFEKGFTGENGRLQKRASGLGLYLAKSAADLLQIPLSAESTVGEGSRFSLDLRGKIKTNKALQF